MVNTLYEFYTGQGQKLPALQERAKLYEQYGLGSANTYSGSAQQNTTLLQKLQAGSALPANQPPVNTNTMIDQEVGPQAIDYNLQNQSSDQLQSMLDSLQKQIESQNTQQVSYLDALRTSRESAGIPAIESSYNDLQTQLQGVNAEQRNAAAEPRINSMTGGLLESGVQAGVNAITGGTTPESFRRILQSQSLAEQAGIKEQALQRAEGLAQQEYGARTQDIQYQQEQPSKMLDLISKIFGIKETQQKLAYPDQETVLNLAQTYPDAGINKTDSLETASAKVAESGSFAAKNTSLGAIANPVTGEIIFYDRKGNVINKTGGTGTPSVEGEEVQIPTWMQPALKTIAGITVLDQGVLGGDAQKKQANNIAGQLGIKVLSAQDTNKIQEATQTVGSAMTLMDTITSMADKLIYANSPTEAIGQYVTLKAGALLPGNAKVFADTVKAFSSLLTRAAGEKGMLTNIDVQRIINALPNFYDTKDTVQQKTAALTNIFQSQVDGAVKAYLGVGETNKSKPNTGLYPTPTGALSPELQAMQGTVNDPMGLFE